MPEVIALDRLLPALLMRPLIGYDGERALDGAEFCVRVGAWYAALDLPVGSSVALAHSNAIEFCAALYAAWLRSLRVLVPGDTLPATVDALRPQVAALAGEFATDEALRAGATAAAMAENLPLGLSSELVLCTSGSTGHPLRLVKRLAQLDAEVAALESCFGAGIGRCRVAATVSHQHIYGLLFRLLWPLASNRPIEAHAHAYLESVAAGLRREPLLLVSSPAHLKRLPPGLDFRPGGNALRALLSSGGALSADTAARVGDATGVIPIDVYGSTETGGIACRRLESDRTPYRLLPGVELRAACDGGLELRSPFLDHGEWQPLADRGELLADGNLRLLGRQDRIVKIEEKRISLSAIERAALLGGWLSAARVLLLPGPRTQLGLVGVPTDAACDLLLHEGRRTLVDRIRAELAPHCERVAVPRRLRLLAELPSNAQGKTTEAALAALFADTPTRPSVPYYTWLRREPDLVQAELLVGPDLHGFQGHFPGQPILPGVTQIDWAIALAREVFALPARLQRMEVLKFQAVITPGTRLTLDLLWRRQRQVLEFRSHSVAGAHASARLLFGEAHG